MLACCLRYGFEAHTVPINYMELAKGPFKEDSSQVSLGQCGRSAGPTSFGEGTGRVIVTGEATQPQ